MSEPRPASDRRRQSRHSTPLRDASAQPVVSSPARARHGVVVDGCALRRRLHAGSVTQVWRARRAGGSDCVVKFPLPRWTTDRGAARLIERECEFLEAAAQPGVVETFGLVATESGPGLLLEYLPGGDLVALAGSHPRHWAGAAADIARALRGIHEREIVHGDVKPRNVQLDLAGRARLIDFGSAARAGTARRAGGGTAAYRSAGQRSSAPAAPADDLHAFAATVYELLAGELPFGPDPAAAALESAPRSPLHRASALGGEPAVVALAEITQAALASALREPAQTLRVFESMLEAINTD